MWPELMERDCAAREIIVTDDFVRGVMESSGVTRVDGDRLGRKREKTERDDLVRDMKGSRHVARVDGDRLCRKRERKRRQII